MTSGGKVTKNIYSNVVFKYKFELLVLYLSILILMSSSVPLHFRREYCAFFLHYLYLTATANGYFSN